MSIAQSLLPEFDHEMETTRRILASVPQDRADFQPHPKSMVLGRLALHIADMPTWAVEAVNRTSLDVNPPEGWVRPTFTTTDDLLATFDTNIAAARAAIAGATDEELMVPWSLTSGEQVIFTLPRVAVLRSMVFNHIIHHRAQLGVYLRLLDVPLPGSYGPTADEMAPMADSAA